MELVDPNIRRASNASLPAKREVLIARGPGSSNVIELHFPKPVEPTPEPDRIKLLATAFTL